jgi:hypothetical protein
MTGPEWKLVGSVQLGEQHFPSRTRHWINGERVADFTKLELATYVGRAGYFLLRFRADDTGTDTWHQNLDDAFHQAEWEFGVTSNDWQMTK